VPLVDLPIEIRGDGTVVVPLHVQPGARRAAVLGLHAGALKVAVTAPPERGRANDAVLALLAGVLGVPARDLTLVSGHTARAKRVAVRGLEAASVRKSLERVYRPPLP
jgi:uncharacterized protein (TIGR00251 family)